MFIILSQRLILYLRVGTFTTPHYAGILQLSICVTLQSFNSPSCCRRFLGSSLRMFLNLCVLLRQISWWRDLPTSQLGAVQVFVWYQWQPSRPISWTLAIGLTAVVFDVSNELKAIEEKYIHIKERVQRRQNTYKRNSPHLLTLVLNPTNQKQKPNRIKEIVYLQIYVLLYSRFSFSSLYSSLHDLSCSLAPVAFGASSWRSFLYQVFVLLSFLSFRRSSREIFEHILCLDCKA